MPVYSIPSKKDIGNYLNDYETEGMSKEDLLDYIYDIIDEFYSPYPVVDLDIFFMSNLKKGNMEYKTLVRNIIPFLILNNICRIYYVIFEDGNPHYELFPNSKTNQDKELFSVLNDNPVFPTQSIDKETFESSYTRIDKNGNYISVKV